MQSPGTALARSSRAPTALARRRPSHGGRSLRRGTVSSTAAALHPFPTERIEAVRSHKTIYVRFDLNDYSIPPEAVGRQLALIASDTEIRIQEGTAEIARHRRTYDRGQMVLDPAHQQALLNAKRKAFDVSPTGRLSAAAPESKTLLEVVLQR